MKEMKRIEEISFKFNLIDVSIDSFRNNDFKWDWQTSAGWEVVWWWIGSP